MKIGILDCDDIIDELVDDFTSYAKMFEDLLRGAEPSRSSIEFVAYKACHGEFPSTVAECDAYLITGSKTGVYDDVVWRAPLRKLIQEIYDAGINIVGICFGHQLLADVLGGKAEKSDKGWGIGAIRHQRQSEHERLEGMPESLTLLFSHQDQVTKLPPNAKCLYGNDFCENGAFSIGNQVLAFQGHPEFTKEYSERLMNLRSSRYPKDIFEGGLASLTQNIDEQSVAHWMWTFLTKPSS
jgi:GMP synthase-like glutamine amidotransferase